MRALFAAALALALGACASSPPRPDLAQASRRAVERRQERALDESIDAANRPVRRRDLASDDQRPPKTNDADPSSGLTR